MLIEFWEFDILIPEDNDAATWEMKKWLGGERERDMCHSHPCKWDPYTSDQNTPHDTKLHNNTQK